MHFDFQPVGKCENVFLTRGRYALEVWGAEGGNCGQTNLGRGGYSYGIYKVSQYLQLTVCVGKQGSSSRSSSAAGGFNGGGNGKKGSESYCSGGGGGATDIRTSSSSSDRIIVAGGGGGLTYYEKVISGGFGGGPEGGTFSADIRNGRGASQLLSGSGGIFQKTSDNKGCTAQSGTIQGKGGNGCATSIASSGGGGGGYYGGGGGADIGSGGGGYGYASIKLKQTKVLDGNQTFLSPLGVLERGHKGDGFARITIIHFYSCIHHPINHISFLFLFLLFQYEYTK